MGVGHRRRRVGSRRPPFDQPDVEASKTATRKLTADYEKTGVLPVETPIFTSKWIDLFTDEVNAAVLAKGARSERTLVAYLRRTCTGSRPAIILRCWPTSR